MKLYKYKGQYLTGEKTKGSIVAGSREEARRILQNRGIFTKLEHVKEKNLWLWAKFPLMASDWHFIFSSLAKLIDKIPPQEAVQTLIEDQINPKVALFLLKVRNAMEEGLTLSQAFEKAGAPDEIVSIIRNGETSGTLSKILKILADIYEERASIFKALISSSIIPAILFVVLIVIVVFVIPSVISSFTRALSSALPGYKTPLLTKIVVAVGEKLPFYGTLFLILLPVVIAGLVYLYRNSFSFKKLVDKLVISLPVVGKGVVALNLYKSFLSFYVLYKTGFPVRDALENLVKSTSNYYLKRAWKVVYDAHIRDSLPLPKAFSYHPYVPAPVKNFINIGYRAGELTERLEDALFYLRERYYTYMNFVKESIAPIFFIISFVIISVVFFAVVMPIFAVMKSLKNL